MIARDIISDVIPVLKISDTGSRALSLMEIFRISHLPIVEGKKFLGLISDTDIYDMGIMDDPLGNHRLTLFSPFVLASQHIYEVIEVASRLKLTVIPVLDEEKNYLGIIGLSDLVSRFSELTAAHEQGAVIILEMEHHEYSLSQIAQIVESNNSRILSLYITNVDSNLLDVTIKINNQDISSILKTFDRYNYHVKATYMDDENLNSFYQNRLEQFMRYLDV